MSKPKFQVGDRVYYPHLRATGVVRACVNERDRADVKAQGYRYEIEFRSSGWTWSVLESQLKPSTRREVEDLPHAV